MITPTEEQMAQRLQETDLENPAQQDTPEYELWRIGFMVGAMNCVLGDDFKPVVHEGWEAGRKWLESIQVVV